MNHRGCGWTVFYGQQDGEGTQTCRTYSRYDDAIREAIVSLIDGWTVSLGRTHAEGQCACAVEDL